MEPMFAVRCDPPYEDLDGGTGECLNEVTGHDLPQFLASLADMTDRLDPGQVPMIIEVRRLADKPACITPDWEDPATRQVNYV